MHQAAGQGSRFLNFDRVAQTREMIGGRQSARAGTDYQDPLATRGLIHLNTPALRRSAVTEKTFQGVDTYRRVQFAAIARIFARVITNSSMHGGHGVVAHERFPSFA